ncbi:unnamed protein product [Polarella glacialis]|uniref:Uncharacterized protein n=1 Tax=Polarella glacialis TaxID=89957 RepID=A0A813K8B7_POLGL|nr:unnamed protein product [Polarella glacialis]
MANAGRNDVATSDRLANWAGVLDDRLRAAIKPGAVGGPFGAVAVPAALLGGLFAATLLGAASYRRSAKQLARALPPLPPLPQANKASVPSAAAPGSRAASAAPSEPVGRAPKPSEVLTKGELVRLFVVPGICAAALVSTLGGICRWSLDVDTMDDAVRQVRWLLGSGARPSRIGVQGQSRQADSE